MSLPRILLLGTLLLGAAAAPAGASTIDIGDEGAIVYRADGPRIDVIVVATEDDVRFYEQQEQTIEYGRYCRDIGPGAIECSGAPSVSVVGGALADDVAVVEESSASVPVTVDGQGGDDELRDAAANAGRTFLGGAGNDLIEAYGGADQLVGGPGDDRLRGGAGPDVLRGEDGNDELDMDGCGPGSADVADGGAGIDTVTGFVESLADPELHPPVEISLDGAANDGRPGEGDNVMAVERVTSYVHGTFVGSDDAEKFDVWANTTGAGSQSARRRRRPASRRPPRGP